MTLINGRAFGHQRDSKETLRQASQLQLYASPTEKEIQMLRLAILCTLLLSACATGTVTSFAEGKLEGPKIVALDAPRTPWMLEIESRLRKEGFQVLRWASTSRVKEQTSETRTEEFRKSAARYVLVVEGYAPLDKMRRCIAGGYNFDYLQVELVDTKTNETILNVSGSGYSENCPPASGTIFSDIANALNRAWK